MRKAVAIQAVFLVGVIAIFLFFIIMILAQWINVSDLGGGKAGCTAKLYNYCSGLVSRGKPPYSWPSECNQYDVSEPSKTDCCQLLKVNTDSPKCTN